MIYINTRYYLIFFCKQLGDLYSIFPYESVKKKESKSFSSEPNSNE